MKPLDHEKKQKENPDPLKPKENRIRSALEEKEHTPIKRVLHCGMPITVYKDKDSGEVDQKVFCYGCHHWMNVEGLELAPEEKNAKKN